MGVYNRISELSGLSAEEVSEAMTSMRGNAEAIESNADLVGHIKQALKEISPTTVARIEFDGARLGQDGMSEFVVNRVIGSVQNIQAAQQQATIEQAIPSSNEILPDINEPAAPEQQQPMQPQVDEVQVFNNVEDGGTYTIMNRISDISGLSVSEVQDGINSMQDGSSSISSNPELNEAMKQAFTEISPTGVARFEHQAQMLGQPKDGAFVMNRVMAQIENIHEVQLQQPQQEAETPTQKEPTQQGPEPMTPQVDEVEVFNQKQAEPMQPQEDPVEVYNDQSAPAVEEFKVPESERAEFEAFKRQYMQEQEAPAEPDAQEVDDFGDVGMDDFDAEFEEFRQSTEDEFEAFKQNSNSEFEAFKSSMRMGNHEADGQAQEVQREQPQISTKGFDF